MSRSPVAVTRSPVDLIRSLIDRIFPRGALILSVLSFSYFIAGIIRNRIFANTYGAGPELDAYNAAFRIPEIALDVLVAAGLTAPFVPIFSILRHDDERSANDFGRTVLTVAVLVMAIASGQCSARNGSASLRPHGALSSARPSTWASDRSGSCGPASDRECRSTSGPGRSRSSSG